MKKGLFLRILLPLILIGVFPIIVFISLFYPEVRTEALYVLGLTIIFVFLFGINTSKNISAPIKKIIDKTKQIKQGNLQARIEVESVDELGELAQSFNRMAAEVDRAYSLRETTNQLVNLKVKKKTKKLTKIVSQLKDEIRQKEKKFQQKIKETAKKERKRNIEIINNLTDGLITLNQKGEIIQTNPKIEEMFSVEKDQIQGKKFKEMKNNSILAGAVNLLIKKGKIKKITKKEFSPKPKLTFEVTSIPMEINSREHGYLLIFHDVSREKLIQKLKTEFVTLSAHQLRTPLSGIKWTLKMLLNGEVGKLKKEQKVFLKKIYQNNERMIKLINDLLDVTKIEEGRYIYYARKEDILETLKEVLPSLKDRAKQKGIELEIEKPPKKIPKFKMDKEKIIICMQNLITNAIKYTKSGGKATVGVEYKKKKNQVFFWVKDNGIGISKEQQKRVFDKFFRSSKAMKKQTVGSGLGLYITKNIIESHGGEIWFESEEGKGSIFYFSLPTEREKNQTGQKKKKRSK